MGKNFKFADLPRIPSVAKAMEALMDGKPIDQAEITVDIAKAIAIAIKKSEERDDG